MAWCEDGDIFMTTNNYFLPMGDLVMCVDSVSNNKTFYSFEHKKAIVVDDLDKSSFIKIEPSEKLLNKKICITGTLDYPRKLYQKIIAVHGGTFVSTVTRSTDLLVIQDKFWKSSKTRTAASYNVKIVDLNEFVKIIKS